MVSLTDPYSCILGFLDRTCCVNPIAATNIRDEPRILSGIPYIVALKLVYKLEEVTLNSCEEMLYESASPHPKSRHLCETEYKIQTEKW
jgi:hypothetical protein